MFGGHKNMTFDQALAASLDLTMFNMVKSINKDLANFTKVNILEFKHSI